MNATSKDRSGLHLSLPARAENVAVIRHALAGLAERIGMSEATVADLKTVVTEACMNAVVHAYPEGRPGPLEVDAFRDGDGLTVAVRDLGSGIQPRPDVEGPSLRIGLALIAALSSSFEIRGGTGRGTEIRMHLQRSGGQGVEDERPPPPLAAEEAELQVGPPELVGPVLGRALTALAARREIPVERISDAMLLSDAISAGAPLAFADGQINLSIADREEGIELRVGPMRSGGAGHLRDSFELPDLQGSLADLADELRIEAGEDGEYLVVGFASLAA